MKTLGLIGGIGPESTIEYYRFIIAAFREQNQDDSYPPIIINSVNLTKLVTLVTSNQLEELTNELVREVEKLAMAGADFAAFASNTPHLVFDAVQNRSRVPLLSIVEAACERVQQLGLKRVGLFGTRFTMEGSFYPAVFSRSGIELIVPDEEARIFIHDKYMNELLKNIFLPETRDAMLAIANNLKEQHKIEALILGGTELPLLLRDAEIEGIPMLDTTRIHVDRLVSEMLAE
jgi:aspartate racemase